MTSSLDFAIEKSIQEISKLWRSKWPGAQCSSSKQTSSVVLLPLLVGRVHCGVDLLFGHQTKGRFIDGVKIGRLCQVSVPCKLRVSLIPLIFMSGVNKM